MQAPDYYTRLTRSLLPHLIRSLWDQIRISGFSRGTFAACALTDMLQEVELLYPQLPLAYAMYER